jgi:hypothetical protein
MHVTVEQINDQVQMLSVEDLRKVSKLVDSLLVKKEESKPTTSEEEFEKHLAEEGFITEYKPPIKDFERYETYKSVTIIGEPISETIIRERR